MRATYTFEVWEGGNEISVIDSNSYPSSMTCRHIMYILGFYRTRDIAVIV
jgi:hypothetical protein